MDDFGILIYLVGLVAYYIYRAYKKATKAGKEKQQRAPQPATQPARQVRREQTRRQPPPLPQEEIVVAKEVTEPKKEIDLDDIFREMFDIPEVEIENPIEDEIEDRIDDVITAPKEIRSLGSLYKKEEYKPSIQFDESDLLVGSTGVRKKKNRIRFNLKKAIIYNAIMERPYK